MPPFRRRAHPVKRALSLLCGTPRRLFATTVAALLVLYIAIAQMSDRRTATGRPQPQIRTPTLKANETEPVRKLGPRRKIVTEPVGVTVEMATTPRRMLEDGVYAPAEVDYTRVTDHRFGFGEMVHESGMWQNMGKVKSGKCRVHREGRDLQKIFGRSLGAWYPCLHG